MDTDRSLALLDSDVDRLVEVAAPALDAAVPSCEPWRVRDLLEHVALVYLHKVECMRRQAPPEPWPPDVDTDDPVGLVRDGYRALRRELTTRGPAAPSPTWYPPDQTVGFWYRRMAHETAIHRIDAELATGAVTPVDAELAVDGVDEVLVLMLAGDWSDEPVEEGDGARVVVTVDGRAWHLQLGRTKVTCAALASGADPAAEVESLAAEADLVLGGDPGALYRWVWGRGDLDPSDAVGDASLVPILRRRLAIATQ